MGKRWMIDNVKTEDGHYGVHGKDEDGKRTETFFELPTFTTAASNDRYGSGVRRHGPAVSLVSGHADRPPC
jgi:hypothetical protein